MADAKGENPLADRLDFARYIIIIYACPHPRTPQFSPLPPARQISIAGFPTCANSRLAQISEIIVLRNMSLFTG